MSETPSPSIAVALQYDKGSTGAPRVVAAGRGYVSERIVEVAREHGIPLQRDPGLAAALSTVELDQEIPPQLYKAVAQVLGFILKTAGHIR